MIVSDTAHMAVYNKPIIIYRKMEKTVFNNALHHEMVYTAQERNSSIPYSVLLVERLHCISVASAVQIKISQVNVLGFVLKFNSLCAVDNNPSSVHGAGMLANVVIAGATLGALNYSVTLDTSISGRGSFITYTISFSYDFNPVTRGKRRLVTGTVQFQGDINLLHQILRPGTKGTMWPMAIRKPQVLRWIPFGLLSSVSD